MATFIFEIFKMKNQIVLSLGLSLCLLFFAQNNGICQNKINPSLQKQYLPVEIQNLYIGMSQKELKQLRPKMQLPTGEYNFSNVEKLNAGRIKQITASMLDDKTIYEFTLDYQDEATAIFVAKQIYRTEIDADARFPHQWTYKLSDGLTLKIWVFKNKICIADSKQF
jgi:hypothetical protein